MHAVMVGGSGVAPNHCVVAHGASGRVKESAQNGVTSVGRDVQAGGFFFDVCRVDNAGVDALQLVDFGSPVHGAQCRVGVGQGQVATAREHDVEV